MLSKKMLKTLNYQINREFYSSYLYLGMASWAEEQGFMGVANWMKTQKQEETFHAEKMYNYVSQHGCRVEFDSIEKPPQEYSSVIELFERTLEHEKVVTGLINDLVTLAKKENDHATEIFLQWFVSEQVEEESNASDIIQKLKLAGKGPGLFMINSELASRTFTPPVEG